MILIMNMYTLLELFPNNNFLSSQICDLGLEKTNFPSIFDYDNVINIDYKYKYFDTCPILHTLPPFKMYNFVVNYSILLPLRLALRPYSLSFFNILSMFFNRIFLDPFRSRWILYLHSTLVHFLILFLS